MTNIFTPFQGLLPFLSRPEPDKPISGDLLDLENWGTNVAIHRRIDMHPDLIQILDDALKGTPQPFSKMKPFMPGTNHYGAPDHPSPWNGTINGYKICITEEILWLTLRDWYGWSVPCLETVRALKEHMGLTNLIEFGQGTGYFASVLEASGISMITSECFNQGYDGIGIWRKPDFNDSKQMFSQHPDQSVLLSWPDPRAEKLILDLLSPGQEIIITGDRDCCALPSKTLQKNGFTHIPEKSTKRSIASAIGELFDLEVWKAPE